MSEKRQKGRSKKESERKPVVIRARNLVEKQNILNEIQSGYMTLQEVRFLAIYLSRINARDPSTRVVSFPLSDFVAIMEIQKVNIQSIIEATDRLLCKVVNVPDGNNGYIGFQLFKECRIYVDEERFEWIMQIDAHDRALPLFFEYKKNYFTYQVGNVLRLLSTNQIRVYEILKQYEYIGYLRIGVKDLRGRIGIPEDCYPNFGDFKIKILDSCQRVLEEKTDIRYEYELIKKGRGGKVVEVYFTIFKNEKNSPQITVEDFMAVKERLDAAAERKAPPEVHRETDAVDFGFLSEALDNEFTKEQVKYLYDLAVPLIQRSGDGKNFILRMYDYLKLKHDLLNTKTGVKHRYGYLKKLIELDAE